MLTPKNASRESRKLFSVDLGVGLNLCNQPPNCAIGV